MLALEKKYGQAVNFIIVDVDDPDSSELLQKFDIYYIPAFFVIAPQGDIVYKATGIQSQTILENALNFRQIKANRFESFFNQTLPDRIAGGGYLILILVFLGGLLTSLSPCILSMLPVMIGYIGGLEKPTRTKGFITSALFVFGLAVTFALLGIVASLFGKTFGQIGTYWLYILGFMAILMGLQLLGVINFKFPGLQIMPEKIGGIFGPFGVGLLFGLVASPCATPVLAVLVTYVALHGAIGYGALLLFVYGLGHGLPLILAGTFTAVLKSLPRFQKWSQIITYFSGGILITLGLYFLYRTSW